MQRTLRIAINNHVVILMISFGLFYEVTNIIWYIHFYLTDTLLAATPAFCRIWVFIDAVVYVIIGMLMAWASIERHIISHFPSNLDSNEDETFLYPLSSYDYLFNLSYNVLWYHILH